MMMRVSCVMFLLTMFMGSWATTHAAQMIPDGASRIGKMIVYPPFSLKLLQEARQDSGMFVTFTDKDRFVRIYQRQESPAAIKSLLTRRNQIVENPSDQTIAGRTWTILAMKKSGGASTFYMTGFWGTIAGVTYFGYGRAGDANQSQQIVRSFLETIKEM